MGNNLGYSEKGIETWCATVCHREQRDKCTQSELGHACVPDLRDRIDALQAECDNLRRVLCQNQLSMMTTDMAEMDVVLRDVAAAIWGNDEARRLYPPELDGKRLWACVVRLPDVIQREVVMELGKKEA